MKINSFDPLFFLIWPYSSMAEPQAYALEVGGPIPSGATVSFIFGFVV